MSSLTMTEVVAIVGAFTTFVFAALALWLGARPRSKQEDTHDKSNEIIALYRDTCMRAIGKPFPQNRNDRRKLARHIQRKR